MSKLRLIYLLLKQRWQHSLRIWIVFYLMLVNAKELIFPFNLQLLLQWICWNKNPIYKLCLGNKRNFTSVAALLSACDFLNSIMQYTVTGDVFLYCYSNQFKQNASNSLQMRENYWPMNISASCSQRAAFP